MVVALGSTSETRKETRESQEVSNLCPTSVQPHFPRITVHNWGVQPVQPISIHKVVLLKKGGYGGCVRAEGVFGNSYREVGQVGQVGHLSSALSHLRGTRYGAVTGPASCRL